MVPGTKAPLEICMSSVLVTGSSGFLGRAVCALLREQGQHFVALDRAPSSFPGEHSVTCDITDARALRKVFSRNTIQSVIHLAAVLPTAAQRDPAHATRVNVDGALLLLQTAYEFKVRRFVLGSSASVYGSWPAEEHVTEGHRSAPQDLYGAAKLYIETLGAAYRAQGLEFASLRIARVVGPGSRSRTSAWRSGIFEALRSERPSTVEMPFAAAERILLIHVQDAAMELVKLASAPALQHGVYNAPSESIVVAQLKREVESLNPRVHVKLGTAPALGNPRRMDSTRFQQEFGMNLTPIATALRNYAENS